MQYLSKKVHVDHASLVETSVLFKSERKHNHVSQERLRRRCKFVFGLFREAPTGFVYQPGVKKKKKKCFLCAQQTQK